MLNFYLQNSITQKWVADNSRITQKINPIKLARKEKIVIELPALDPACLETYQDQLLKRLLFPTSDLPN